MKKFKPCKIKNGSIRLPEEFLDQLLLNDGDYLLIVEEDGRFYIRKTRETSFDDDQTETTKDEAPKTFDEIMKEAQKQFGGENLPEDLMKQLQSTLQDPEMMKKIQDMAMGIFKGFSVPPTGSDEESESESTDEKKSTKKKTTKKDDDEGDDGDDGFKINIE